MSKHKKTREQKKISTLRRQLQSQQPSISHPVMPSSPASASVITSYSLPINATHTIRKSIIPLTATVTHDIQRSLGISLLIVLFQVFLYFLFQRHIISVPFVQY